MRHIGRHAFTGDAVFDTDTLKVDATNNRVGMGTAVPDEQLHLKSSTSLNPIIKIENTNADHLNAQINFVKTSASEADDDYLGQIDFEGLNDNDERIVYGRLQSQAKDVSDGTEDGRVFIGSMNNGTLDQTLNVVSGNVGVGTTNPTNTYGPVLHIAGANPNLRLDGASSGSWAWISMNTADAGDARAMGTASDGSFRITNVRDNLDSGIQFRIEQSGNIGIGTAPASGQKLHVAGNARFDGNIGLIGNSGTISPGNSGAGYMRIFGGGTNEGGAIEFRGGGNSGDLRFLTGTSGAGTERMRIDSSGNIKTFQATSISYTASNDYLIYYDDKEVSQVENNASWQTQKTVDVSKSGTLRVKFSAYIQSGNDYWAWQITKNGTEFSTGAYTQGLDTGNSASVHNYRTYKVDVTGVNPGDTIAVNMKASDSSGGGFGSGGSQNLYLKNFRLYSGSPSVDFGGGTDSRNNILIGADHIKIEQGNVSQNLKISSTDPADTSVGATFYDGGGNWRIQLYGSASQYGFLNGNWASWDLRKVPNGALYLNNNNANIVWHGGNDGSGSGLDADTVDGIQGSSFLRSDSSDTSSQRIGFQANATNNWDNIHTSTGYHGGIEIYNTGSGNDAFMAFHAGGDYAFYFGLDADSNDLSVGGWSMGAVKYKVWHAGNDGSGSGLDADTLDGVEGSNYLRSNTSDEFNGTLTIKGYSKSGGQNRSQAIYMGQNDGASDSQYFTMGWKANARSGEVWHTKTGNGFYIEAGSSEAGGFALDEDGMHIYSSGDGGQNFRVIDKDSDTVQFQVGQGAGDVYVRNRLHASGASLFTGSAQFDGIQYVMHSNSCFHGRVQYKGSISTSGTTMFQVPKNDWNNKQAAIWEMLGAENNRNQMHRIGSLHANYHNGWSLTTWLSHDQGNAYGNATVSVDGSGNLKMHAPIISMSGILKLIDGVGF